MMEGKLLLKLHPSVISANPTVRLLKVLDHEFVIILSGIQSQFSGVRERRVYH